MGPVCGFLSTAQRARAGACPSFPGRLPPEPHPSRAALLPLTASRRRPPPEAAKEKKASIPHAVLDVVFLLPLRCRAQLPVLNPTAMHLISNPTQIGSIKCAS